MFCLVTVKRARFNISLLTAKHNQCNWNRKCKFISQLKSNVYCEILESVSNHLFTLISVLSSLKSRCYSEWNKQQIDEQQVDLKSKKSLISSREKWIAINIDVFSIIKLQQSILFCWVFNLKKNTTNKRHTTAELSYHERNVQWKLQTPYDSNVVHSTAQYICLVTLCRTKCFFFTLDQIIIRQCNVLAYLWYICCCAVYRQLCAEAIS